jgi:hypothetical protein
MSLSKAVTMIKAGDIEVPLRGQTASAATGAGRTTARRCATGYIDFTIRRS